LFLAVISAPVASGEDAAHETRHGIADRHVDLAEKLEKKHPREAFEELVIALEMDPNDYRARTKLGYKRDENKVWRGNPQLPLPGPALDAKLLQERDHVHKDSATKLLFAAKHLAEDKKNDDARALAGLALEENLEEKGARDMLGHEKRGEAWTSPRERHIRAAFAKALASAKGGEAKASGDDEALAKLCGVGALDRKESEHAVIYSSKAANVEADALLRTAETAWLAQRYFIAGDDNGFSVEGDPKRQATGGLEAPNARPDWLIVADAEHGPFIEASLADKSRHAFAKSLTGWAEWQVVPSGQVLLCEGHFAQQMRAEWVSAGMADYLTWMPLGKRALQIPEFMQEGVKRFFSGHVSGRAEIFYANLGSSTSKRSFQASTFDALRAHAREGLREVPPGELRSLLAKKTNDLDQVDSAVALAFMDFLLARKRAELATFFTSLKEGDPGVPTLEAATKKTIEELDAELREFVREEY
jgi:hypothetical protein